MTRTILGLGGSDHDASAALVRDGEVVCAIEEERVTRKKYGFDGNLLFGAARKYVLEAGGVALDDVDLVIVDEILPPTALHAVRRRARLVNHHILHAASAFYPSDFDQAAILVVDNAGSFTTWRGRRGVETTTFAVGTGTRIDVLDKVVSERFVEAKSRAGLVYQRGDPDDSLGHLYKLVSHHCGFDYLHRGDYFFTEDGKTMGLAPYGTERFYGDLRGLVRFEGGGRIAVDLAPDGAFHKTLRRLAGGAADFQRRADLAWAGQTILEEAMLHLVEHLHATVGGQDLCIAGGVALNSVANGRILREGPFRRIFVPPACGDTGTSLGAAWIGHHRVDGQPRRRGWSASMGRAPTHAQIEAAAATALTGARRMDTDDLPGAAASLIATGHVLGWFQGGAELGPRALGHRSILADPRDPGMKDHLNGRVKHREAFRPFAPSVLAEHQAAWFEMDQASPHMLFVAKARAARRAEIPAVVHVDGSARIQSVDPQQGLYREMIDRFYTATGVPMVLNTSFNVKGEPMVDTPDDAVRCFLGTGIDALVLGHALLLKPGVALGVRARA